MFFWENFTLHNQKIALYSENGDSIIYSELEQKIKSYSNLFSEKRNLIFLECSNSIECLVVYLAALRYGQPILLLDESLDAKLKEQLIVTYNPNLIISQNEGLEIEKKHTKNLDLDAELALLLSTSGTTGSPKLVKLSKQNIHENASSIAKYLELSSNDKAITLLPMHYSYGLSIINSHLLVGGSITVTNKGLFDKYFWVLCKENSISSLSGVPYIYEILHKLRFSRMNLPDLRYLTQAGGKLSEKLVKEFAEVCEGKNIKFYVMYGQTEATARISYLDPSLILKKPGSIGRAIPGGELKLFNQNNNEIHESEKEGELVYYGPNVMLGYANSLKDLAISDNPLTALKTGDLAKFDNDGDFYITGRLKRFIKIFGLRVSLDKIESDLRGQGYECACSGRDEMLYVAIVGENPDDIKEKLAKEYKIAKNNIEVQLIDSLAKTASGKLDYKKIFKLE